MNKPNPVLVTGGVGYIGSHTVRALLDQGCTVYVLDNLSRSSIDMMPKGAEFVQGDIADIPLVESLLRSLKVKDVLHFAAYVDVAESVAKADMYRDNNYLGTKALVLAAKRAGVKRFIFSSTAAVYGNPDIVPVPENAPTKPVNPYGESKLFAEAEVKKSGLQYAILRYFNVAGADADLRAGYSIDKTPTHLIRTAVRVGLGDIETLPIFGTDYPTADGTTIRDFIHVTDLADAHVAVLKYLRAGNPSDTFNVGYGKGYSVKEVVNAVENVMGSKLPVEYKDRRDGDPVMIIADNKRLLERTAWKPKFNSLGVIIIDEINWVKSKKPLRM